MAELYRKAMDGLYYACVGIGCFAMVMISAVIPWAVFTRYADRILAGDGGDRGRFIARYTSRSRDVENL